MGKKLKYFFKKRNYQMRTMQTLADGGSLLTFWVVEFFTLRITDSIVENQSVTPSSHRVRLLFIFLDK